MLVEEIEFDKPEDVSDEKPADPEKPFSFWNSWIATGFCAILFFLVTNLLIGELAYLGYKGALYYNTGALIFTTIFFIADAKWTKQKASTEALLDG